MGLHGWKSHLKGGLAHHGIKGDILENAIKILNAIGQLLRELTSSRIFLLVLLGLSGILIRFGWDNRQDIVTKLITSPYLATGLLIGAIILFIGYVFNRLIIRSDEVQTALRISLEERIEDAHEQLNACLLREGDCQDKKLELIMLMKERNNDTD